MLQTLFKFSFTALAILFLFSSCRNTELKTLLNKERLIINFIISDEDGFLDKRKQENKNSLRKKREFWGQFVFYPQHDQILMINLHPAAKISAESKAPISLTPSSELSQLKKIINFPHEYSIHIRVKNLVRLFNVLGGLYFFNYETLTFKNSLYQYPAGLHYYTGEQILEYITAKSTQEKYEKFDTGLLLRFESIFLASYWEMLKSPSFINIKNFSTIYALLDTNFNKKDLYQLLRHLRKKQVHLHLQELPLMKKNTKKGTFYTYLHLKKAQTFFEYLEARVLRNFFLKNKRKIEILNATNRNGLGKRMRRILKSKDIYILNVDNYKNKKVIMQHSYLVDYSGSTATLSYIEALIKKANIRFAFHRSKVDVDAALILGKNLRIKSVK